MPPPSLISDRVICQALTGFARDPLANSKLSWWLRTNRNATERWFQFELAYHLQCCLPTENLVLCEQNWRDISVQAPGREEPAAAVELKWWGNWSLGNQDDRNDQARDVDRVNGYGLDAIALMIWLFVDPEALRGIDRNQALLRDIERTRLDSVQAVRNKVSETWPDRFHLAGEVSLDGTEGPTVEGIQGLALLAFIAGNRHHTNAGVAAAG